MNTVVLTKPEPKPEPPPEVPPKPLEDPVVPADPDFIAWLQELL